MSTGKIELSVGAVKIADKNEMFTEEEINNIDKIPELDERVDVIEDEIEEINSSLDNIANRIDNLPNISPSVGGLSETDILERARGKVNLFIETPFDGGNQPYHPSVLKFDNAWNGYKYWMAYTPYPYGDDSAENPCIVASNDLLYWEEPKGLTNPIDTPSEAISLNISYWSDNELVYNETTNKLECWYRGLTNSNSSVWVRKTSSNGVTWSAREQLKTFTDTGGLSASVIRENGKYKIWVLTPNVYYETSEATNWGNGINYTLGNYWHGQVRKTSKGYEYFAHIEWPNNLSIDHFVSEDGLNFEKTRKIISSNGDLGKPFGIDAKGIYRPCFIIENNRYYLFYCTGANDIRKGITLSISDNLNLDTLRGIDESFIQYMKKPTKQSKYGFEKMIYDVNLKSLYYCISPTTTKGVPCNWELVGSYITPDTPNENENEINAGRYTWINGYINASGNVGTSLAGLVSDFIPVTPSANYTIKDTNNYVSNIKIAEYNNNKLLIVRQIDKFEQSSYEAILNTLNVDTKYIRIAIELSSGNISLSAKNYILLIKA